MDNYKSLLMETISKKDLVSKPAKIKRAGKSLIESKKGLTEATKLEVIKSNKKAYEEVNNYIKTLPNGFEKDIYKYIVLEWIKGHNWLGGISDSVFTKQYEKYFSDYDFDVVLDKFHGIIDKKFDNNDNFLESLKEDLLPDEMYDTLVRKSKKTYTVGVYSTLPGPGWHYEINTEYGVYAKVPDEEGFIAHWFLQGLPQESEEDVERVAKRIINQYGCKEVSLDEYKRIINGKDESLTEDLNRSFVELESFKKSWRELGLSEDDLKELQNLILTYPEVAIPLGSNVFKVRFSPSSLNKGKDTSTRVIYIDIIKDSLIYLVTAFSKSNEKNISSKELRAIKDIAKEL